MILTESTFSRGKIVRFVITLKYEDDIVGGVGESITEEMMSMLRLKDN